MTILSEENLRKCIETARTRSNWKAIASCVGASEQSVYNWLRRSKKDAAERLEGASPFYLEMPPDGFDWVHSHFRRSRIAFILMMEGRIIDEVANDRDETCFDPSTGRPLLALDPQFIGISDSEMEEQFLNPAIDRYLWERDENGNRIRPIYQIKKTAAAAQLKIKALSALLPKTWGERAEIDHKISGQVVHTIEPKFVSRNPQPTDVIDAQFTEAPQLPAPEREDIAELRRRAEELMRDGPKNPRPNAPVRDAAGQIIGAVNNELKPNQEDGNVPAREPRPLDQHPRAYRAPAPEPQRPAYARRPDPRDPNNPANRAMKVG